MSRWMPALLLIAALVACSDSEPADNGGGEDNNDVLINNDTNNDTSSNNDTGNNDTNNDTPMPVCGDGQCEDPETEASCPQDCAEPQCEADEVRCADTRTLERCNDPFAGFEAEACPEAQFCVEGVCQDAECELGTIQCLGRDTSQACVDVEGIPTIEVQPCDDGFVCTEGGCQEQVCDPDAPPTCLDSDTALFCDPPGIATREQDCFQGQICLNAGCQTQLCNPGVTVCRGEVIERCNDLGTAYEEVETCNPQDGTSCIEGECVDACTAAERLRSYQGCAYTALDLPNSSTRLQNGFGIAVANTSETQTATATVEIEGEIVDTLVIPPRGVGNYVDVVRDQRIQGTGIFNAAFRILSDIPVVVYQFNVQRTVASASTDASLLFPDHALFNQYLVMTYSGDNVGSGSEPYVAIAAIEDETNVTFTPTSATKASIAGSLLAIPQLPAGQEHTVTLNAGQVLSYVARTGPNDLTGSPVLADRPVAAFGGNFATQVPTGRVYRDHLEQQIFPRQALGHPQRRRVRRSRHHPTRRGRQLCPRHDRTVLCWLRRRRNTPGRRPDLHPPGPPGAVPRQLRHLLPRHLHQRLRQRHRPRRRRGQPRRQPPGP